MSTNMKTINLIKTSAARKKKLAKALEVSSGEDLSSDENDKSGLENVESSDESSDCNESESSDEDYQSGRDTNPPSTPVRDSPVKPDFVSPLKKSSIKADTKTSLSKRKKNFAPNAKTKMSKHVPEKLNKQDSAVLSSFNVNDTSLSSRGRKYQAMSLMSRGKQAATQDVKGNIPTFSNKSHREILKQVKQHLSSYYTCCQSPDGNQNFNRPIRLELRTKDKHVEYDRILVYNNYPLKDTFLIPGSSLVTFPSNRSPYDESECYKNENHLQIPLRNSKDRTVVLFLIVSLFICSQHFIICQDRLVEFLEKDELPQIVDKQKWTIPYVRNDLFQEYVRLMHSAEEHTKSILQTYISFRAAVATYLTSLVHRNSANIEALKVDADHYAKEFFTEVNLKDITVESFNKQELAIAHRDIYFFWLDKYIPNKQFWD